MFNQTDAAEFRARVGPLKAALVCMGLQELEAFVDAKRLATRRWSFIQRIILGGMLEAIRALREGVCADDPTA